MSDLGKRAGTEARKARQGFSAPDLELTIRRRRRARFIAAALTSAVALVLSIGAGALFMRTETETVPADSTTTTTPAETTTPLPATTSTEPPRTTTTTLADLPTEPVYGGTVTVVADTELIYGTQLEDGTFRPATINPLLDQWNASDVARLSVPGAYRLDPGTGEAKPWVLAEIPRLDNGGVVVADGVVTIAYEIRPGAQWADGTPISFSDFAFTHELIMRDDLPIDENLQEIHSLIDFDTLTGQERAVWFELTNPDPRYERLFPWLVPAHAVESETFGEDWNDKLWLSGGPFVFENYIPSTDPEHEPGLLEFRRNDNYWESDDDGNQLPYLDGIEIKAFGHGAIGEAALATWFTSGSVDAMMGGAISYYHVPYLGDPDEEGFILSQRWDSLYEIVGFQLGDSRFERNPDSLNEHLLYRQAVLSAIDRAAIGEAVQGPVVSIAGAASPGLQSDIWDQYDDPARTAELLALLSAQIGRDFEADPPKASLVSSTGDSTILIGETIVEQLTSAGWEASAEFSWDFFSIWFPEGLTDVYTIRLFAGDGIADMAHNLSYFDPLLPEGERFFDWAAVGEPAQRFSDLMAEARVTLDQERLTELLLEAEAILADNAVVYPLALRQVFYVPYWPERIQGIVAHQGWDSATAAWWWSPEYGG